MKSIYLDMKEMTIREIQMICLDILKDIHEFCVQHNIKYSLSGGSLLGAIRHNGFIPWDDDADIQMPRPDYDRFIKAYKSGKGFVLYSRELEDGRNVLTRIARVCDNSRTYVDQGPEPIILDNAGVWIDIIPVEGAPDDHSEAKQFIKMLRIGDAILSCIWANHASIKEIKKYQTFNKRLKFAAKKLIGLFVPQKFVDSYIEKAKQYNYNDSTYIVATPHYRMREWQPKCCMESYELHQFEDTELYIMSGFKDNLTCLFGNFMDLPPVHERISHNFQKRYWKN